MICEGLVGWFVFQSIYIFMGALPGRFDMRSKKWIGSDSAMAIVITFEGSRGRIAISLEWGLAFYVQPFPRDCNIYF